MRERKRKVAMWSIQENADFKPYLCGNNTTTSNPLDLTVVFDLFAIQLWDISETFREGQRRIDQRPFGDHSHHGADATRRAHHGGAACGATAAVLSLELVSPERVDKRTAQGGGEVGHHPQGRGRASAQGIPALHVGVVFLGFQAFEVKENQSLLASCCSALVDVWSGSLFSHLNKTYA